MPNCFSDFFVVKDRAMLPAHLEKQLSDLDPRELGPHAVALLDELRRAARAGMPLTVLVLAATLVDVVANEEAGPAGHVDGMDFAYAGNKAALGWLRGRRNELLHHEGPADGLMGEPAAVEWQWRDAERGLTAFLDYLDDLVRYDLSD